MEPIFYKIPFDEIIVVDKIVTFYYFEYASNFVFKKGEKHDFWEFLYVDKGEVEIMADTKGYKLVQGDIVFHKPNEFHSVWANGKIAPNLVITTFDCSSPAMKYFDNKILRLNSLQRNILAELMKEVKMVFVNDFGKAYEKLIKKENTNELFGAEQLVKLYLELFLIQLVRDGSSVIKKDRLSFAMKERMENDIVENVIEFLQENINTNLTFDEVCAKFSLGRTHLKTLFKDAKQKGVMCYFKDLKIEEAKKMIREGEHNFTEISQSLGFESVHYFSRCFKGCANMTPSEYSISVKSKAETL